MNIKDFKIGDEVTRNEPMKYSHNGSADSSYCGNKMMFLGIDEKAKMFFVCEGKNEEEPIEFSYARDAWDEGWCAYPKSVFESAVKKMKEIAKK